ncbi:acetylornithine deacetylase [Paracoccus sp. R86501]|uniref:acetylornithine deacetylase n=1 Tax=Paracoccus sp. R86501 TaxID=3101711 RepID=UPI0036707AD0
MTLTDILAELVAIPSLPGTPNDAITDAICTHLDRPGVTLHRLPTPEGRWNILASIGPADVPGLMLSGHSDVVPAHGQQWSSDPFRLTAQGDRLVGRGTSDMKGFLAVMLDLLPDLLAADLHRPVHFAISCDEEIGCQGVPHLIARLPDLIAPPLACIVGEPSDMSPVLAHKGKQTVEVTFAGTPGHSSDPARGMNAIYPAARFALQVEEMARALRLTGPFDAAFDPPCSTLQAGVITGGTAVNIIPDMAKVLIEARGIPDHPPETVIAGLVAGLPEGATHRVLAAYPALRAASDPSLAHRLSARSGRPTVLAVSYGTEAGVFAAAGIPSVICGPGKIERSHRADEFIRADELALCRKVLLEEIRTTCACALST